MVNTIMNANEADAVLGYLEFHLIKFVEDMEKHISDPDVIGGMYDRAYAVLNDFEGTLDLEFLIQEVKRAKPQRKRSS